MKNWTAQKRFVMCQVANRNHQMLWFRMLQKRVLQWHVASRNHEILRFRIAQERFLMWQVSSRNNSRWLWVWEWVRGQVSIRHQVFSFSANCVRCFVVRRKLRAKVREVLQLSERFMWFVKQSEMLNARGVCVSFFLWQRTTRVFGNEIDVRLFWRGHTSVEGNVPQWVSRDVSLHVKRMREVPFVSCFLQMANAGS